MLFYLFYNFNKYFHSTRSMLDTILCTLQILAHLYLITTLRSRHYLSWIDKETQRLR